MRAQRLQWLIGPLSKDMKRTRHLPKRQHHRRERGFGSEARTEKKTALDRVRARQTGMHFKKAKEFEEDIKDTADVGTQPSDAEASAEQRCRQRMAKYRVVNRPVSQT
mmetsp:Transcript_29668/g.58273  ORF Transcript_29668/g.58273 Transcript_29668/m.58273 type:complete len:108 (-) Transcript_29668:87-410(-)